MKMSITGNIDSFPVGFFAATGGIASTMRAAARAVLEPEEREQFDKLIRADHVRMKKEGLLNKAEDEEEIVGMDIDGNI